MENSVIDINQIGIWIIGIILLLGVFSVTGAVAYFKFFKRKRTRENFAFVGLTTLSSLVIAAFVIVTKNELIGIAIGEFLNLFFGFNIKDSTLDTVDKAVITFLVFLVAGVILFIFRDWPTKSTLEVEREKLGQPKANILQAASIYIQARLGKVELVISIPAEKEEETDIFSPMNTEKLPWHIQASQLLKLDPQYKIDLGDYEFNGQSSTKIKTIGKDWYQNEKCFLAKYGRSPIAILCVKTTPELAKIQTTYDFACEQLDKKPKRILVLVEQGEPTKKTEQTLPFVLEYKYKKELLTQLVNFDKYKEYLTKTFYEDNLANSENTLSQIYTPLSAIHRPLKNNKLDKGEAIANVETYVLNWIKKEEPANEHLAILGQYGQGKSVLSQKIALTILENPEAYDRIPVIIELRGSSPRNMSPIDLLARFAAPYAISPMALYRLHQMGKLVIILEAFDEMDLVGDAALLKNHFQQLWQFAITPKAKIIITGRPNLFIDYVRRREALGIYTQRTSLPYTHAIELQQMNDEQVQQALRDRPPQVKNGIRKALQETGNNTSFDELVRRPSTLYQLSVVWEKEEQEWVQDLNAASVIQKFIYYDYERQEKKYLQEHQAIQPLVTMDERHYFMQGIALGMVLQDGYSNQINQEQLKELVQKLWNNFPEQLSPYKGATKGTIQDKLKKRLIKHGFETILTDIKASGILVEDMHGGNQFKFAHKSYLELLVSDFYTHFILQDKDNAYDLLIANTIAKVFTFKQEKLPASPDVENFIPQLIANRIKLKDTKGNYIAIQEQPEKYSRAIYNKLFPDKLSQWFPNLMSRINLTPDFKFLIPLTVSYPIFLNFFSKEPLGKLLLIVLFLVTMLLAFVPTFIYRKKLFVSSSEHWKRLGLWYATTQQLGIVKDVIGINPMTKMLLDYKEKSFTQFYKGTLLFHIQQISILGFIVFSSYLATNLIPIDVCYLTYVLLTITILSRITIYLLNIEEKQLSTSFWSIVIIISSSSIIISSRVIISIIFIIIIFIISSGRDRHDSIISIIFSIIILSSISIVILSSSSILSSSILLLNLCLYIIVNHLELKKLKKQVENSQESS